MHPKIFFAETLYDALGALEQAAISEPECSQVWTFLGRLYSENYGLETIDRETPIEKAIEFAEKGVHLDPSNQRARAGLALAYLLNDQLAEGRVEANKALAFEPQLANIFRCDRPRAGASGQLGAGICFNPTSDQAEPVSPPLCLSSSMC